VIDKGDRKVSSLGAATERLDRRMNSLIEPYQGVFAGTRIATSLGLAMATVGLEEPAGLDVAGEAGLRNPPRFPGRRLAVGHSPLKTVP
jgi:hypothetical protein